MVLVSGLLTPLGNEAFIILAIHQGFLRPYYSAEMLAEYRPAEIRFRTG